MTKSLTVKPACFSSSGWQAITTALATYLEHVGDVSRPRRRRTLTTSATYLDHVADVLDVPRQVTPGILAGAA